MLYHEKAATADLMLCLSLFIDRINIQDIYFFFHNNRELVDQLRWRTCKLVSLPCEGSNPTTKNICVLFTCSVFLAAVRTAFK